MTSFVAWRSARGELPHRCPSNDAFALCPEGPSPVELDDWRLERPSPAVVVGVSKSPTAVAAILLPSDCEPRVLLNGAALASGLRLLEHGDRLDFAGWSLWTARVEQAAEVLYDPDTQGANLTCARSKARLKPGVDRLVICPGAGCGLIYLAEAWRLGIPCHGCKFDPRAAAWRPLYCDKGSFNALLELVQRA